LDGIQNITPQGVSSELQMSTSNLLASTHLFKLSKFHFFKVLVLDVLDVLVFEIVDVGAAL